MRATLPSKCLVGLTGGTAGRHSRAPRPTASGSSRWTLPAGQRADRAGLVRPRRRPRRGRPRPGHPGRRAPRRGPRLQRRRRHQGDAAAPTGFDALIGANRGLLRGVQGGLRVRGPGDRRGPRLLPRRRRRPGRQRRLHRGQRRRLLRRPRGRPRRARRGHPPGPAGAAAPDAHALLHRPHHHGRRPASSTARCSRSSPATSSTRPRWRSPARSPRKDTRVIRAAKEALNGIDPVDVNKSYRFEQGFTMELNLVRGQRRAARRLRRERTRPSSEPRDHATSG